MARSVAFVLTLALCVAGCGDDGGDPTPGVPDANGPAPTPVSVPAPPSYDQPADFVGRWSSRAHVGMWMVLRDDGRYRYSGQPATSIPIDPRLGGLAAWQKAHTGTWRLEGGTFEILADEEADRPLLPFELDAEEGTINLRVIGFAPSGATWIVFFKDPPGS